ncbi:MAG: hypothetical protein R3335_02530 [Anaerolineales bacterium]|nr:hypothetical protein [Anaerolineales bacterium]
MDRINYQSPWRIRWIKAIWVIAVILNLTGFILLLLNLDVIPQLRVGVITGLLFGFGYISLGAVILLAKPYKSSARIGLVLLFIGFVVSINNFAQQYAVFGFLSVSNSGIPGAAFMGWIQQWSMSLVFPALVAVPYLIFPDGNLPSPIWKIVLWMAVVGTIFITIGTLTDPGFIYVHISEPPLRLPLYNPTSINSIPWLSFVGGFAWLLAVLVVPISLVAPIARFRTARGIERTQLKWLTYFGAVTLLLLPIGFIGGQDLGEAYLGLSILILPTAAAIAVVRHQLYDIDVLINRTLVYGAITIVLGAVYFISVTLFQNIFSSLTNQRSSLAIVLSTLFIAALFQPLRRRVQTGVDRRFYRQKYDTEKTLAEFSEGLRAAVDPEALAVTLLRITESTLKPSSLSLWLQEPRIKETSKHE